MGAVNVPNRLEVKTLHREIQRECHRAVAAHPDKGFHFHTGRRPAG